MLDKSIKHEMWYVSKDLLGVDIQRQEISSMDHFMNGALIRHKLSMPFMYPCGGNLPYKHVIEIERANGETERYQCSSSEKMKLEDWGFNPNNYVEVKRPSL